MPEPVVTRVFRIVDFESVNQLISWVLAHTAQGADLIMNPRRLVFLVIIPEGDMVEDFIQQFGSCVSVR